jgi:hypothetical protein
MTECLNLTIVRVANSGKETHVEASTGSWLGNERLELIKLSREILKASIWVAAG